MVWKNIYKLFYRDYYKNIDFTYALDDDDAESGDNNLNLIRMMNEDIKSVSLFDISKVLEISNILNLRFKILYPGLVTGIGLVHDSKKIKGAFNLGMHFDYTSGMPVVYGSSVKGVLRQYFKDFYKGNLDKKKLEDDIFDGIMTDGKKKSIYDRDIFFDAVITNVYIDEKGGKHLLEDDCITPHGANPLKNPKPITMLKIAAGCTINFRFSLKDSLITAKEKKEIFKKILETVGIGAKTNVGYGQFLSVSVKKKYHNETRSHHPHPSW